MGEGKTLAAMDERANRSGTGTDLLDSGKWIRHHEDDLCICDIQPVYIRLIYDRRRGEKCADAADDTGRSKPWRAGKIFPDLWSGRYDPWNIRDLSVFVCIGRRPESMEDDLHRLRYHYDGWASALLCPDKRACAVC